MTQPVLDMTRCQPESCPDGRCLARLKCPKKALWQEEPFAPPFLRGFLCHGCSRCLAACPQRAIRMG